MEIKLTPAESEEYFHNALCNGLSQMMGYGLDIDYDADDYKAAKESLNAKSPNVGVCFEDVFMEILRMGKKLSFKDIEGDGDMDKSITLEDVHNRVQKTPLDHLNDMIEENDDADTADVILQTVFYENIIFG